MGFIRVKLIEVAPAKEWRTEERTFDPFCAVHIKEAVMSPGQGISLVQKKKTIYPEWNKCFDTHLYDGRVISIVVMEKPSKYVADATIGVQFLVDQCKRDAHGFSSVWVRLYSGNPSVMSFQILSYRIYEFILPDRAMSNRYM